MLTVRWSIKDNVISYLAFKMTFTVACSPSMVPGATVLVSPIPSPVLTTARCFGSIEHIIYTLHHVLITTGSFWLYSAHYRAFDLQETDRTSSGLPWLTSVGILRGQAHQFDPSHVEGH